MHASDRPVTRYYRKRPLKAKYVGWCARCGQRIEPGDYIDGGVGGYMHDGCPRHPVVDYSPPDTDKVYRIESTKSGAVLVKIAENGTDFETVAELPGQMFRRLAGVDFGG